MPARIYTLIAITNDIFRPIDKGYTTALILLDYLKALETIDHTILYGFVEFVGFSCGAITLIHKYLRN